MRNDQITGLILAGGRARRMGGVDKGLIDIGGIPMIAHVVQRLTPQVKQIIINANRNLEEYEKWAELVVKDNIGEFDGPLAGMASGLESADTDYVVTAPCDSPLLADDLAIRMHSQCTAKNAELAVASDGNRLQPVFTLLRCTLLPSMISFLQAGERKIDKWFDQHLITVVDFSDKPEAFLNVNTIEEKESLIARYGMHD